MKLSDTQVSVLFHLNNGWELGLYRGFSASCRMQKGKIGHGGQGKTVNWITALALEKRGLIAVTDKRYPAEIYNITPAGIAALEANTKKAAE